MNICCVHFSLLVAIDSVGHHNFDLLKVFLAFCYFCLCRIPQQFVVMILEAAH